MCTRVSCVLYLVSRCTVDTEQRFFQQIPRIHPRPLSRLCLLIQLLVEIPC